MTNIYIKSFNRPFYLDRCIRSVKFNVRGADRIIVLDDGTEGRYLERLTALHPDVEFRTSGASDRKVQLLREEAFEEIARSFPSAPRFWTAEIEKDPHPYVMIIEDDAWVCRSVDLSRLTEEMARAKSVILKLWWSNEDHRIAETLEYPDGSRVEYVNPVIRSMFDAYQVWIVAFAVFDKTYWLNNVSAAKRLADEKSQLAAALDFLRSHPGSRIAKTASRCVHQGWMVPGRSTPEYYDKGLRQHVFMDAANQLWFDGLLDPTQGYPYDFSDAYLDPLLASRIGSTDMDIWREWRRREISYWYDDRHVPEVSSRPRAADSHGMT